MDVLTAIDRAIEQLCPCGGSPRPGSAYCSYDCEPNWRSVDTSSDIDGTAMRWRPDLVSELDDSGLTLVETFPRGRFNAHTFIAGPDTLHLRLDDGHRFVGVDIDRRNHEHGYREAAWQRLERELSDSRRVVPAPRAGTVWIAPLDTPEGSGEGWREPGTITHAGITGPATSRTVQFDNSAAIFAPQPSLPWGAADSNPLDDIRYFMRNRDALYAAMDRTIEALRSMQPAFQRIAEAFPDRFDPDPSPGHPLAVMNARRTNRTHGPQRPQRPPRQLRR